MSSKLPHLGCGPSLFKRVDTLDNEGHDLHLRDLRNYEYRVHL